jgi:hypothetical protein
MTNETAISLAVGLFDEETRYLFAERSGMQMSDGAKVYDADEIAFEQVTGRKFGE